MKTQTAVKLGDPMANAARRIKRRQKQTVAVPVPQSRTRKMLRRAFEAIEQASSLIAFWAYKQRDAIGALDDEHEARLLTLARQHMSAIEKAYRKAASDKKITPEENARMEEHFLRAMRTLTALAKYDTHENAQHVSALAAADATRDRCRALNITAAEATTDLDYRQGGVDYPIRLPSTLQTCMVDFAAQPPLPLEAE